MFKNHPEVIALGLLTVLLCSGPADPMAAPNGFQIRNLILPGTAAERFEVPPPPPLPEIIRQALRCLVVR